MAIPEGYAILNYGCRATPSASGELLHHNARTVSQDLARTPLASQRLHASCASAAAGVQCSVSLVAR